MSERHVVVVGGGIAGLAAAYRLTRTGNGVTVVEADDRVGGKLRTSPFAGRPVDEGADAFLLRVPWAADLCRALGLEGELTHPAVRRAYVWRDDALRELPPQLMGVPTDLDALAASGLVSPAGLDRARRDLTAPRDGHDGHDGHDDETIAAVVERRLGPEVLAALVDPLVGGINAGDTRRLSLAAVVPQLRDAAHDPTHPSLIEACRAQQQGARAAGADADAPVFATPLTGMGRLVDALVAAMPEVAWCTGRRAVAVSPEPRSDDGGGIAVDLDDATTIHGDGVVIALPAWGAAPMLAPLAPTAAGHLAAVEHASVAMVTLAVDRRDLGRSLDGSGFLVPRGEAAVVTACSWASSKWAHLAPEHGDGTVLLRASAGRHGDEHALDLDDDDLVTAVVEDLARTMDLRGPPAASRVTRWPDSFPQYAPGHLDRVAAVESDLALRCPRVVVAGAALRGVGVPACIRSGLDAADRVSAVARP